MRRWSGNSGRSTGRIAYYIPTDIDRNDGRADAVGVGIVVFAWASINHANGAAVASNASIVSVATTGRDGQVVVCGVRFLLV